MLAQGGGKITALPRAVRNQEIEESSLFSGFLPFEETPRVTCEFEKPHPLVHVGLVRGLVLLDLTEAAGLLLSPGRRHPLVERSVDPPVQLVDIHRVKPFLQAL